MTIPEIKQHHRLRSYSEIMVTTMFMSFLSDKKIRSLPRIAEIFPEMRFSPSTRDRISYGLRQLGLTTNARGPGGGVKLSRPLADISMAEVLDAALASANGPAHYNTQAEGSNVLGMYVPRFIVSHEPFCEMVDSAMRQVFMHVPASCVFPDIVARSQAAEENDPEWKERKERTPPKVIPDVRTEVVVARASIFLPPVTFVFQHSQPGPFDPKNRFMNTQAHAEEAEHLFQQEENL